MKVEPPWVTMLNSLSLGRGVRRIGGLSFEKKLLGGVWLLFVFLVAAGIHGSSTGITSEWWMPEKPYTGYLFNVPGPDADSSRLDREGLKTFLMANARPIRWDELAAATPYALSQSAQHPRFPVINKSYGEGQNMLLLPFPPVLHIATLARPATWGYFLLGNQRGLAWSWWFQVFGCFTVLFLLFKVILNGQSRLAAFGAFWFCASAYVVCWSIFPAHVTLFATLGCLAAYYLFASHKKGTQLICGILLGLSFPAFVMLMYPAWQVQLGYFAMVVFAGLVVRDKLYVATRVLSGYRLLAIAVAGVLAGGLTLSWVLTCLPDLRIMSHTVYPGNRVSVGGGYSLPELFKGTYNLITIYKCPVNLGNPSEASSFYYLFPAIFLAIPFSRKLLSGIGVVGQSMVVLILAMLFFQFVGLPTSVAKISLLSYVPAYRADLAIGLASIVLCLSVLAMTREADGASADNRKQVLPVAVGGVVVMVFILHGLELLRFTGEFPLPPIILFMSLQMGFLSYALLAGKKKVFCALMGLFVVATTAMFNPLATNLNHIYDSELARKIVEIDSRSDGSPLWLCYGGQQVGALVSILGGRSLTGIQWVPQLSIWHALDPDRAYEQSYNSYNEVNFAPSTDDNQVSFQSTEPGNLLVRVSPHNPTLRSLGARYVLLAGDEQKAVNTSRLQLIYKSSSESFSIFEIPRVGR